MKRIVFFLCLVLLFSVYSSAQVSRGSDSTAYYRALYLKANDSIKILNRRTVMTTDDFVRLYKYDRLLDYYERCKKNPVKWKFYKGWSIRVLEQ